MIRTGGGDAGVDEWDTHLVLMELVNKQEGEVTNQTIPQINAKLQLKERYPAPGSRAHEKGAGCRRG